MCLRMSCNLEPMNTDWGHAVLNRRLELGYASQRDAAAVAGVGTTTWGLIETGRALPKTARVRRRVAMALQWPPDALDKLAAGAGAPQAAQRAAQRPRAQQSSVESPEADQLEAMRQLVQSQLEAVALLRTLVTEVRAARLQSGPGAPR